ncbi:site-2 protease family protein [Candidatus Omnitrophota bacterium]
MIISIVLKFTIVMFAIAVHESAHGWVAYKLGDPTAKYMGRLTLNPLAHIDPFGTVMLPLILVMLRLPPFGYAKPVPVNFLSLNNPKKDMLWVGLAGPTANVIFALLLILILKVLNIPLLSLLGRGMVFGIFINMLLGIFNLVPIPPLDGSRIVTALIPYKYAHLYNKIQPFGFIIVIALLWSGMLGFIIVPIYIAISRLLGIPPYILFDILR